MSSTSYTYTKSIKNVTFLMGILENLFKKHIETYDYNPDISELVISVTTPLSENDKAALDTLVNNFVDSSVLTTTDLVTFKNLRAYKSTDQVISTTLNAVTEVLFQSTSHIDRHYYQMSASSKFIYIQKPGTYLILAKVGALLAPNAVAGTNTVMQWALSYDDTRSEIAYINILNTNTYTCHTNLNTMADSTLITAVFTVTSTSGTNLRLTGKRILGTTPLTIDGDCTSIQIIAMPGVSFYEGNISSNVTLTTTPANINIGSDRIVQFPFSHTLGQPNITVNLTGNVAILVKATFNKTVGTDTSFGTLSAKINGTVISSLNGYTHAINAVNNKTTVHFMGIIPVTTGDVISLQANTISGTNLQLSTTETGIVLMYLNSSVIPQLNMGCFYNGTASDNLSITPVDISTTLAKVSIPASPFGITPGSNIYAVTSSGLYIITANLTFNNPSGNTREVGVYITTSMDGKIFYSQPSILSLKQLSGNSKTTVTTIGLLNLPTNSKVKITAATNGTISDQITVVVDGTLVNFLNFKDLSQSEEIDGIFANKFATISSPDELLINTSTYMEKCRIVCHNLTGGIYRLGTNSSFTTSNNTTTLINVQLLDIHSTTGNSYIVYTKTVEMPAGTYTFVSTDYVNALDGAHVFLLQISSPFSIPFIVKNTTLETWRVA